MQKFRINLLILMIVAAIFNSQPIKAQTTFTASDSVAFLNVTGTSTLHGWTVAANTVSDLPETLSVNIENGQAIAEFGFGVAINGMDGGRGASMNKKITDALKASSHPVVSYQQKEPAIIKDLDKDGHFKLLSKGILTIVGTEKPIEIEVTGQKTADGQLILKGNKPMKFSDFNIEPPSAMFGQIVCGDDISVNFEFRYKK